MTAYSESEITALYVDTAGNWRASGYVDAEFTPNVPWHERFLAYEPTNPDLSAVDLDVADTHGTVDAVATVLQQAFDHRLQADVKILRLNTVES